MTQLCHCLACQCSAYDELQFQACFIGKQQQKRLETGMQAASEHLPA